MPVASCKRCQQVRSSRRGAQGSVRSALMGARKLPESQDLPRLALTKREAAEALGMSIDSFERYVQPDLRVVRRGRMRLIPVRELQRWVDENASKTLSATAAWR